MTSTIPDDRTIDLHAHTTASDGDHTPTQLVERAAALGLTAIAITDHDTMNGVREGMEAGKRHGVEVVPGIELSTAIEIGQCHLLGYFLDPDAPEVRERLERLRNNRARRNAQMVEKLNALGIDLTLQEVAAVAGGEVIGRPHFARALLERGDVSDLREAFDRYLADGAAAHVPKDKIVPEEAIRLLHAAGGVVILAHPNYLKRGPAETEAEILRLQSAGLDGIEARYSRHTPEDTARYLDLAERHGLLTSGGSDFHGPSVKPDVFLGHVEGGRPAPGELLNALRAAPLRRIGQACKTRVS